MKAFLTLSVLVFSSVSFASYTPYTEVTLGNDNSIHVQIVNDSGVDLNCKYSVSWFVNTLNYKKEFGQLSMSAGSVTELTYLNDQYARLSKIKAKAICD